MSFDFVGIDTETTGLDKSSDEIIEVVAIEFNLSGETGRTIHQLCRPASGFIPPAASRVNNIKMNMVKDKPNYLKDGVREKIAEFIGDRTVVGHNLITFDLPFMKIETSNVKDTLVICREKIAGRHNLKACCKKLGLGWDDEKSHRAEYDTIKCIELFCKLNQNEKEKEKKIDQIPMFDRPIKQEAIEVGVRPTEDDRKLVATQSYSVSRIKAFKQCPFKWYMMYIKGLKQPDETFFKTGKACHSIAEWSGAWCYRELFANKFESYFDLMKFKIGDNTRKGIASYLNKEIDDISSKDIGYYLYENTPEIRRLFPKIGGKASLIEEIDKTVDQDSYETPSKPPIDIYNEFVDKAISKHKCVEHDVIIDIKSIMKRFYEKKDFSLLIGDITITERKLAFDKNWNLVKNFFGNNVFFRGIIDVIDYFGDVVVITDYKTSRTMLNERELKEDIQMRVYALLVYMLLPKNTYKKVKIRIDYIRFGKSIEYEIPDIKEESKRTLDWISDSIQEIEAEMLKTEGAFAPVRNEYCHSCHLREDGKCPLFDKRLTNNIDDPYTFLVQDVDDCVKAWKRIEANKAENSRLIKHCKNFVQNCPDIIKIDKNAKLDFFIEESVSYDPELTMKLMLKKGIDIRYLIKFFGITKKSMDSLCEKKDIEFTKEELDSISIKKTRKSFEALTIEEAMKKKFINP